MWCSPRSVSAATAARAFPRVASGSLGASLENPLGSAASHGCVRVDNDQIEWMAAHIQPGTPVDITG